MPAPVQWVITCVAEGQNDPVGIVADFLEALRGWGYTIVAQAITPASDIAGSAASDDGTDDNAKYPTFGDIVDNLASAAEILDGHDYASTYAGFRRGH